MKFSIATFGVKSSPFRPTATLPRHLKSFPPSTAITVLEQNMYVDDLLSGAECEEEALTLLTDARDVLVQAGKELTSLSSNSRVVFDKAFSLSGLDDGERHKDLGVEWKPCGNVFSFAGVRVPGEMLATKRATLSLMARMFDPL